MELEFRRLLFRSPIVGKNWDDRYGALDDALLFKEEGETPKDAEAHGSDPFLKATLFNVDGSMRKIFPGCLLREVSINVVK